MKLSRKYNIIKTLSSLRLNKKKKKREKEANNVERSKMRQLHVRCQRI